MSATQTVLQNLYLDSAKLAYTESQMAISPRLPLEVSDANMLMAQAMEVGNEARRLRGMDPQKLDVQRAANASNLVKAAQAIFDQINTAVHTPYRKADVTGAVDNAIAGLRNVQS